MPARRDLTKEEILVAMNNTRSVRAAARYMGCSYWLARKWMKFYRDEETGLSLCELHNNKAGIGVPKGWKFYHMKKEEYKNNIPLLEIIEGKIDISNFTIETIKKKFINEGYLIERCSNCGFCETRVLDNKIPLVFHFKDHNKKNYKPDNITLLCYNCYFLHGYEVFDKKTLKEMENFEFENLTVNKMQKTFEVDDYHMERLRELGLLDDDKDDEFDIVSRK